MHMNDFKISWVAWLGSLTKPSQVEPGPALRPPRYYGRLIITASFFGHPAKRP